jgi:WhiB family redox-sensing transcriptional regulator
MTTFFASPEHDETTEPTRSREVDGRAWMVLAACQGRTPLFFGTNGERPQRRARREARARKLCVACPVLEPCREYARANRENGFWGAESEEERAAAGYPPLVISRRSVQWAATQVTIARRGAGATERLSS